MHAWLRACVAAVKQAPTQVSLYVSVIAEVETLTGFLGLVTTGALVGVSYKSRGRGQLSLFFIELTGVMLVSTGT